MRVSHLFDFCQKTGIRLEPVDTLPRGAPLAVALADDGYKIYYTHRIAATDEAFTMGLIHEIGHILRGDLLALKDESIDGATANIAMDSVINTKPILEAMHKVGIKGVDYDELREQYEELPEYKPGWRVVYDVLSKHQHEDGAMDTFILEAKDLEEAIMRHIETVTKARQYGLDGIEVKPIVDPNLISVPKYTPPNVHKIDHVLSVLDEALSDMGRRVPGRTWLRPSRVEVGDNVMLKGQALVPSFSVALVLDVSGSMTNVYSAIMGIAHWLLQTVEDMYLVVHTDRVLYKGEFVDPKSYLYPGGTEFTEAWQAAQHADVIVHVTDTYGGFDQALFAKIRHKLVLVQLGDGENAIGSARWVVRL